MLSVVRPCSRVMRNCSLLLGLALGSYKWVLRSGQNRPSPRIHSFRSTSSQFSLFGLRSGLGFTGIRISKSLMTWAIHFALWYFLLFITSVSLILYIESLFICFVLVCTTCVLFLERPITAVHVLRAYSSPLSKAHDHQLDSSITLETESRKLSIIKVNYCVRSSTGWICAVGGPLDGPHSIRMHIGTSPPGRGSAVIPVISI